MCQFQEFLKNFRKLSSREFGKDVIHFVDHVYLYSPKSLSVNSKHLKNLSPNCNKLTSISDFTKKKTVFLIGMQFIFNFFIKKKQTTNIHFTEVCIPSLYIYGVFLIGSVPK